jgi:Tfp pilus assembly protein PilF
MAASMPTNAEVYNNYGIALLQRATAMRAQGDTQAVAETQFESSILALREAAKNAPTNGDILVNLAIALIESGRPEKALGIMNVYNARTPGSAKGLNTAAAVFELGQLTQAVETLGKAGDDAVIRGNLLQLSPKAAHS